MNKVQHFEIPADDLARAKKFYNEAFNWGVKDWPMSDGSTYVGLYTGPVDEKNMWKEPGFINGGMFQRTTDIPAKGPTFAVTVPDIHAVLEKVKTGGGVVLGEIKNVEGMGMYAYIKDTEGNIIGVWQDLKK